MWFNMFCAAMRLAAFLDLAEPEYRKRLELSLDITLVPVVPYQIMIYLCLLMTISIKFS